jgi:hypothetical protein
MELGIYPRGGGSVELIARIIYDAANPTRGHILFTTGLDYQIALGAKWDNMELLLLLVGPDQTGPIAAALTAFEFNVWYHIGTAYSSLKCTNVSPIAVCT